MEIRVMNSVEDYYKMEALRSDAFEFDNDISQYYLNKLNEDDILILAAYINGELAGGLYFLPFISNRGIIDQLFVKKKYQFSDYHVGTTLLKYVEEHINDICEYFDTYIKTFIIEPSSDESEKVYRDNGYRDTALDGTLYKRIK